MGYFALLIGLIAFIIGITYLSLSSALIVSALVVVALYPYGVKLMTPETLKDNLLGGD